ncbi:hypothetical protein [Actinosynnema sp. ALI-1.44]|uniref:hypothetical protein n=1 Tax=Actinosynnema sp. ALI-1.44 TaxID=1933779 RepID=UPI001177408C|nr:hypothetical protein [Actinosynnema sp. ALI-1.44]
MSNGCGGLLDQMLAGTVFSFATDGWGLDSVGCAAGNLDLASTFRLWDRNRTFYAAHSVLVAEMAKISSTPIPGKVWMCIPHTEPLILLPDTTPINLPSGDIGVPTGFFVQGRIRTVRMPHPRRPPCRAGVHFLVRLSDASTT